MKQVYGTMAVILAALLLPTPAADAQDVVAADAWRAFAQRLEAGADLHVRLASGQRFRATFVEARADAMLLQPKTRRAVPIQPVAYDAILSLERRGQGGMGAGKATLIGVASGTATFFGILLVLLAAVAD